MAEEGGCCFEFSVGRVKKVAWVDVEFVEDVAGCVEFIGFVELKRTRCSVDEMC